MLRQPWHGQSEACLRACADNGTLPCNAKPLHRSFPRIESKGCPGAHVCQAGEVRCHPWGMPIGPRSDCKRPANSFTLSLLRGVGGIHSLSFSVCANQCSVGGKPPTHRRRSVASSANHARLHPANPKVTGRALRGWSSPTLSQA